MISSLANAKIKRIRRLLRDRRFRRREGCFVVEGKRWLDDVLHYDQRLLIEVFCTQDFADEFQIAQRWQLVSDVVMKSMTTMETPPGIVAVIQMQQAKIGRKSRLLILDRIQNPGNLGTILRTASASGVDGVVLSAETVDPYNPKVLHSSMGAHLRIPIISANWDEIAAMVTNLEVWYADAGATTIYTEIDLNRPHALIVGNEANGIGLEAQRLGNPITIPMVRAVESLNVAMATGIILFEAARQRNWK